jgi:hypothetical protein
MLNVTLRGLPGWSNRVLRDRKNTLPTEAAESSRREREEENLLRMTL